MPRKESASPAWTARTELLLELVRLDTAYADLYLQRARQIAAPELSASDFRPCRTQRQPWSRSPPTSAGRWTTGSGIR